jgi:NADH-quinone oxidoreductase subunit I
MLRCIMCGYCEEVCPEQAIFLTKEYQTVGLSRESMIYPKEKLLAMGGIRPDPIKKWSRLAPPAGAPPPAPAPGHGGGVA